MLVISLFALLLAVGKSLISLFIGSSDATDLYDAAGSILVLMLWVSPQLLSRERGCRRVSPLALYRGSFYLRRRLPVSNPFCVDLAGFMATLRSVRNREEQHAALFLHRLPHGRCPAAG